MFQTAEKNTGKFASTGNRKRRNRQKMKNRQPPKKYRQIENVSAKKPGTDEYPEKNDCKKIPSESEVRNIQSSGEKQNKTETKIEKASETIIYTNDRER